MRVPIILGNHVRRISSINRRSSEEMKKIVGSIIMLLYVIPFLVAGGMVESSTLATSIFDQKDAVSTYLQKIMSSQSLSSNSFSISVFPVISETYMLLHYPEMNAKRFTKEKMAGMMTSDIQKLDQIGDGSGIFYMVFKNDPAKNLFSSSSFTLDEDFLDYVFLDNDRGEFLRVNNHSLKSPITLSRYGEDSREFWIQFGESEAERESFFKDAKALTFTITSRGLENQSINFDLPLWGLYKNMPEGPRDILDVLRPKFALTFIDEGKVLSFNEKQSVVFRSPYRKLPMINKDGYILIGWRTGDNGNGDFVRSDSLFTMSEDQILYANWRDYYIIGDIGPAGGLIFYDKGSYSDGWRYLEVAPSDIEVNGEYYQIFGYYRTTPGGDNLTVGTGTAIGTGEANTENLVESMGSTGINAYTQSMGTTTVSYAANICANYTGGKYDDWFLPSKDELNLMYENLYRKGLGGFSSSYYWSSSEEFGGEYAWVQGFYYGDRLGNLQSDACRVRPVRAF